MSYFKGKTVFITGGSRGIGLAIAQRLAQDGANIAIAAKTVEENPKLPGTIYSAAAEIEAAGGKALPLQVDIRFEDQVQAAIAKTVETFGGLDILINNASAISLTGTLETPMKRYDLMHQINIRGTYLTSQVAIPHLLKVDNPHILNISPPLNMDQKWFQNHVAYTMAKYGMSMCVLGMSGEFASRGLAVNALWPVTAIATAAVMNLLGGDEVYRRSRKPEIMADAAYIVLSRNAREFTGQFVLDEPLLREHGVTDFDRYAFDPTAELVPDFFI